MTGDKARGWRGTVARDGGTVVAFETAEGAARRSLDPPDRLDRDGYRVVADVVGAGVIAELLAALDAVGGAGGPVVRERKDRAYAVRNLLAVPAVRELSASAALCRFVEPVLGSRGPRGAGNPVRQDAGGELEGPPGTRTCRSRSRGRIDVARLRAVVTQGGRDARTAAGGRAPGHAHRPPLPRRLRLRQRPAERPARVPRRRRPDAGRVEAWRQRDAGALPRPGRRRGVDAAIALARLLFRPHAWPPPGRTLGVRRRGTRRRAGVGRKVARLRVPSRPADSGLRGWKPTDLISHTLSHTRVGASSPGCRSRFRGPACAGTSAHGRKLD